MRKSNRERRADERRERQSAQEMGLEGLLKLMLDGDRPPEERRINPTQLAVILSKERVQLYKGPAGCAKTSTGIAKILLRCLLEPGSKHLIARHDYNDLTDTTMLRAQEMVDRLPPGTLLDRDKSPPAKWYISPIPWRRRDGKFDDRPSQITFMGLKEAIGSYEFNSAFLDEADEIPVTNARLVNTRMRNKGAWYNELPLLPNGEADTTGYYSMLCAFNPPDTSHWLYTAATGLDQQGRKVDGAPWAALFEPNPAENVRNLPTGYYDILTKQLPEDMRKRLVDGEWGSTFPGQPVYRQFRKTLHVTDGLEYEPSGTLFRFWDFGYRHPCVIWVQVDWEGRMFILRELMGTDIEVTAFARLVKSQTGRHFPGADRITDIGDIAVKQRKDTGSALGVLWKEGIQLQFQHQGIDRGMRLLRKQFELLLDGKPAIQIERKTCPILIAALSGGYHFKENGTEPFKDGYYDHLPDALRYGVVGVLEPKDLQTAEAPTSVEYDPQQDLL